MPFIKRITYTTPEFKASWPSLREPSKFKGKPTNYYSVKYILEPDSKELKEFKANYDAAFKEAKKVLGAGWKGTYAPFQEHKEIPEGGTQAVTTGKVVVVFKATAVRTGKDGIKTKVNLPIVDTFGDPVVGEVWGGSVIQVGYQPFAYDQGVVSGIRFNMVAVKVIRQVDSASSVSVDDVFKFNNKPASDIVPEEEGLEEEENVLPF